VQHHVERCHDLVDLLKLEPKDLVSLTRDHFSHRELTDNNFFLAITEVMSHIELLEETGDVSVDGSFGAGGTGGLVQWNGTEFFPEYIRGLGAEFMQPPD
jgi:hypothetical protein